MRGKTREEKRRGEGRARKHEQEAIQSTENKQSQKKRKFLFCSILMFS